MTHQPSQICNPVTLRSLVIAIRSEARTARAQWIQAMASTTGNSAASMSRMENLLIQLAEYTDDPLNYTHDYDPLIQGPKKSKKGSKRKMDPDCGFMHATPVSFQSCDSGLSASRTNESIPMAGNQTVPLQEKQELQLQKLRLEIELMKEQQQLNKKLHCLIDLQIAQIRSSEAALRLFTAQD